MTPSELKRKYQESNPEGQFFSRANMRFAGDTMRNYGVRSAGENWELYRKQMVKYRVIQSVYFNKITFKLAYPNNA